MEVMLIKAIDAYFIFDHQAEQREVIDHLRDFLHIEERDARLALAELIADDVLRVVPVRMQSSSSSSIRTRALVTPGPRLHDLAAALTAPTG
jgi:hypothetical protein